MDLDASLYRKIEGLMMEGPAQAHTLTPLHFENNHAAASIHSIAVSQWPMLVNLSLPTIAFQKAPQIGIRDMALCGYHLGGYDMAWLSHLKSLRALSLTNLKSCEDCYLGPYESFETGISYIPQAVEFVMITGRIICFEHTPGWTEGCAEDIRRILRNNRASVAIDIEELWIGRLTGICSVFCDPEYKADVTR